MIFTYHISFLGRQSVTTIPNLRLSLAGCLMCLNSWGSSAPGNVFVFFSLSRRGCRLLQGFAVSALQPACSVQESCQSAARTRTRHPRLPGRHRSGTTQKQRNFIPLCCQGRIECISRVNYVTAAEIYSLEFVFSSLTGCRSGESVPFCHSECQDCSPHCLCESKQCEQPVMSRATLLQVACTFLLCQTPPELCQTPPRTCSIICVSILAAGSGSGG